MAREDERPTCTEDECQRTVDTRGWCEMHYRRWLRTGHTAGPGAPSDCRVSSCARPATSRGWCHAHYQRWQRGGDIDAGQPIGRRRQPTRCVVEICDRPTHGHGLCRTHLRRHEIGDDELAEIPIGSLPRPKNRPRTSKGWTTNGYRYVPVDAEEAHLVAGNSYAAEHRLVVARQLGRPLADAESVHHRNGDRSDNRVSNLELWSTAHPSGQRVADKVLYALEILARYRTDLLHPSLTDA